MYCVKPLGFKVVCYMAPDKWHLFMVALSGELILVSLLSVTNSSTWRCLLGSNLPLVETSYFSRHSA